MNEDLVAIARIAKTRGLRGECVADILTDFPERFGETSDVIVSLPNGERLELKIEDARFQKGRVNLKFAGVNDIDAAEKLRGATVCVPEGEAIELEEGEFFDFELVGCRVETIDGQIIGTLREIMRTGGTEILVVSGESKEYLIPFAKTICTDVDIENKLIRVDPPEGLLDF
jgi:16S rRNA processing protein RimM